MQALKSLLNVCMQPKQTLAEYLQEKEALARERLQGDVAEDLPGEFAAFGISGGRPTGIRALFMSHPPLEERIAYLEAGR